MYTFSLFLFMLRPTPRSTLFPYTTLFRSQRGMRRCHNCRQHGSARDAVVDLSRALVVDGIPRRSVLRSEEHTSELQSLRHLVCRLLLEKKKKVAHPGALLLVNSASYGDVL